MAESVDEHINHGYTTDKAAYLRRLKRVEGQVRGIARMVEEDKYCIDILTQVAAVNKALHAVSLGLVEDHIAHCVVGAAHESEATGNPEIVAAKVKEATDAIGRLLR
ncbi:metal-sensitive transcriptional regulator [Arthrobacter sp. STN4]|uniref:metal-sensitive transcriptional regulator n=1 Tax=Arthrobacter sp. STN4 TaxID=2923276 RepID=UPI002119F9CD|nr:metal-sensitive transcriptional regulator [Arthrobacter sp. STN4]MCQ9164173.1 metal-sensitive transcriptional regulator [Arthrobacter sp. STN4]